MKATLERREGELRTTLGLTLALAALLQLQPPVFGQSLGVIRGLSVADGENGTILTVETSRKLEWTATWHSNDELQLTFPAAVARDDVVDLTPGPGLIESVVLGYGAADDRPATVLTVTLREQAGYSAQSSKKRIEFTFVPHQEEMPLAVPGAEETVEQPAAEAPPIAPAETASEADTAGSALLEQPMVEPPAAARDEISGEYRIGPGDLLEISVFGLDEFDRTVRVLRDGSVSLPLLGTVRVAGMTLQQAERTVAALLSEGQLVNDPQVSFFVKEYVSRGVSVQGAVKTPGVYQMIQQRTLLEILGEAGGLTGADNNRAGQQIFVIRKTADGQQTRIEVDAEQLVNQGRADLNIDLLPGDVVLVPFAQRNRVYVSGAVVRPGPVEFLSSEGITVLQAITAAGGPTERGNLSNVAILRRLPDGTESRTVVNVKKIRKGKQQDVRLERNDTVIVGEWFF